MGISDVMARVARVSADDITNRRPYFQEGNHRVKVHVCKYIETRQNVPMFIVEAAIMSSTNDAMKEGTIYAWVQKLNIDAGPPSMKAFVAAVLGVAHDSPQFDEIDEKLLTHIVSDAQPFEGKEIDLRCDATTTKDGRPFTRHTWG